jgi:GR25 family glycosyltransferase involved in LPS biosynthesis
MNIDKIYIISLDSNDATAQSKIVSKLNNLDLSQKTSYEIFQAWNGKKDGVPSDMRPYSSWKLEDSWNSWWKRDLLPGEIGCMASHIKIWESQVREGISKILVLEDDFNPTASLGALPEPGESYDLLWLGRQKVNKEANEFTVNDPWVNGLQHNYCTHGYILTLEGAKKLLAQPIKQNLIPADEFLSATVFPHRREDIANLFSANMVTLGHKNPFFIEQKRPQEESTIEDPATNPNLMKDNNEQKEMEKQPYFEILDTADWDAWKDKYVNQSMLKGEYDLMVDDLGHNVYEFPLFTEKFCKEAVALSEALDKWTIDRHEFYPTNDVLLQDIGLQDAYHQVLKEVVYPLCIHLWTLEGKGWKDMFSENFLARYTTDRQSHLSLHHDFSHITMVVKLNDEFDGGGTWFPKYNLLSNPERVGVATLHPGMVTHLHGARPIYAGKRYICVSFMRKES